MELTCTIRLSNFEFWSGARHLAKLLTYSEFEQIETYLCAIRDNYSDTDINDLFWFEPEYIVTEILGYEDYDDFLASREG